MKENKDKIKKLNKMLMGNISKKAKEMIEKEIKRLEEKLDK